MKQKRNRRKAPQHPIGLVTLAHWQNSADDIAWTATEPRFRRLVSVLINERQNAERHSSIPPGIPLTENARYGLAMGYEAALNVLNKLGAEPEPEQLEDLEQEFPQPKDGLHEIATTD